MPLPPLFAASLWLQKRVRVTKKYQAHDEQQQCSVGDVVVLAPSRPLSKTKRCALLHSLQWPKGKEGLCKRYCVARTCSWLA